MIISLKAICDMAENAAREIDAEFDVRLVNMGTIEIYFEKNSRGLVYTQSRYIEVCQLSNLRFNTNGVIDDALSDIKVSLQRAIGERHELEG